MGSFFLVDNRPSLLVLNAIAVPTWEGVLFFLRMFLDTSWDVASVLPKAIGPRCVAATLFLTHPAGRHPPWSHAVLQTLLTPSTWPSHSPVSSPRVCPRPIACVPPARHWVPVCVFHFMLLPRGLSFADFMVSIGCNQVTRWRARRRSLCGALRMGHAMGFPLSAITGLVRSYRRAQNVVALCLARRDHIPETPLSLDSFFSEDCLCLFRLVPHHIFQAVSLLHLVVAFHSNRLVVDPVECFCDVRMDAAPSDALVMQGVQLCILGYSAYLVRPWLQASFRAVMTPN